MSPLGMSPVRWHRVEGRAAPGHHNIRTVNHKIVKFFLPIVAVRIQLFENPSEKHLPSGNDRCLPEYPVRRSAALRSGGWMTVFRNRWALSLMVALLLGVAAAPPLSRALEDRKSVVEG